MKRLLLVCLLLTPLALALASCSGGGSDPVAPIASPPPENFAGRWLAAATINVDGCGTGFAGVVLGSVIDIQQTGNTATATFFDLCGDLIGISIGTISGSVITLVEEITEFVDSTCSIKGVETETGVLIEPNIVGNLTIDFSAIGTCGPPLPCQLSGAFIAQRCPPADCTFAVCPLSVEPMDFIRDSILEKKGEIGK